MQLTRTNYLCYWNIWAKTDGLKRLLSYYGGSGPSRNKLEHFIRTYLVYDGASVPDDVIDLRYQASVDPEVVVNSPLRRPCSINSSPSS